MPLQHQFVDRRDLSGDTEDLKSVFIVYFSGERSRQKIAKICDSYAATTYSVPESATLRDRYSYYYYCYCYYYIHIYIYIYIYM
jgi:hypothetical protein